MKIATQNVSYGIARVIRRGKVARKSCGVACRPRVENYFDLERTCRVIFLFGIHFMLVLTKSSDGSSSRHESCLPKQIRDANFIDRIQFGGALRIDYVYEFSK